VGAAIVAGVVAFIISSILPSSYEATALVAVTKPSEIVEFDSRIRSLEDIQPLKAYPEIAKSDELMITLLSQISALAPEIQSVEQLRKMLTAEAGADPSLLRLIVTYGNPEPATEIANLWGDLFVSRVNQIYGSQGGDQLRFYEQQVEAAASELNGAEQALIIFQAGNRASILENQLLALAQTQTDYWNDQRELILLTQDVQALQDQLAKLPNNTEITFADQLVSLALQAKAFDVETSMPVQFQLQSTEALVNSDRAKQLAFLDTLIQTLAVRSVQIEEALADLEPQILALQAEKQETDTESRQILRNFTLAEETYTALTRKVEEERITSQDTNSGVKLVGRTAVPEEPTGSRIFMSTIVASFVGAILIATLIMIRKWNTFVPD
jgi:capsular polysaccharide biosynthesis protein